MMTNDGRVTSPPLLSNESRGLTKISSLANHKYNYKYTHSSAINTNKLKVDS